MATKEETLQSVEIALGKFGGDTLCVVKYDEPEHFDAYARANMLPDEGSDEYESRLFETSVAATYHADFDITEVGSFDTLDEALYQSGRLQAAGLVNVANFVVGSSTPTDEEPAVIPLS
jgi:hypothetical protein